ncbi:MAG TPA: hypothetical protein PLE42_03045 [Candidatus Competibacteraceae bacterium]|nr:hypothetical protein [Candidatus Competibacteraceae bacterium]
MAHGLIHLHPACRMPGGIRHIPHEFIMLIFMQAGSRRLNLNYTGFRSGIDRLQEIAMTRTFAALMLSVTMTAAFALDTPTPAPESPASSPGSVTRSSGDINPACRQRCDAQYLQCRTVCDRQYPVPATRSNCYVKCSARRHICDYQCLR